MYNYDFLKSNTLKYATHSNVVYIAINRFNLKCYIGITTKTLEARKKEHIVNALSRKLIRPFYNSIRGKGVDAYDWYVLEHCSSLNELFEREKYYIEHYNSYFYSENSNGYNLTFGGEGPYGMKLSDDVKLKISLNNRNRIVSEETRRKLSEANKGRIVSSNSRIKISNAHKGRYVGRKLTDEWKKNISLNSRSGDPDIKEKLSKALKGRILSEEHKSKLRKPRKNPRTKDHIEKLAAANIGTPSVVDMINMKWYNSYEEASNSTNIYINNIRNVAMGRRKTAGGLIFKRYIDLNEEELQLLINNLGYKPNYNKTDLKLK